MGNKTRIEWCDYTINPVNGLCPVACDYCYARRMYKRFRWNEEIRFVPEVYDNISVSPRGQKIFVGSTMELFGDWIRQEWLNFIIKQCYVHPWHTFIFLTKRPENLLRWSPFPLNCWVGISATNALEADKAVRYLYPLEAKVKFLSLEPLLSWQPLFPIKLPPHLNWVIIGQQTPIKKATTPKIEWVQDILVAAHNANIPVFMKDNLRPLVDDSVGWGPEWKLRQEFPV